MKVSVLGAAGLLSIYVSGCATPPEAVAPAYVSEVTYQSWTCRQLGEEEQRLDAAYQMAAAAQNHARTNDTIGVIFLGLPVSSLSGSNVAPQIANLKGEQAAVQRAATLKNCSAGGERPAATETPTAQPPSTQSAQSRARRSDPCRGVRVPNDPDALKCY